MLYPLTFNSIFIEKVWGGNKLKTVLNKSILSDKTGESWEISGVKNNVSVVSTGEQSGRTLQELIDRYKADFLGEKVYKKFGNFFPILIKFIDACDDLSVQVHPDDDFAKKTHNEIGKNEAWFIIDAEPESKLILGVERTLTKSEYLNIVNYKQLPEVLNSEQVKPGDALYIPAGRIHAIMKGVLLAEIQQTSDLTYRIYDWDRKDLNGNYRELHNDLAAEVVDLQKKENYFVNYNKGSNTPEQLVSNNYFSIIYHNVERQEKRKIEKRDSFVVLMCLSGSFSVRYKGIDYVTEKGGTILIPAVLKETELIVENETQFLEVFI